METYLDIPVMTFGTGAAWEDWLKENHTLQTGIWMKIPRKHTGIPSVSLTDALDTCLCYGWIDGQRRSHDEQYFLQKYTPRRPRSLWSKVNIDKVQALTTAGRMRPPGLQAVAKAQADGRWDTAYESQKNAVMPPDLEAALGQNTKAKTFYETLNRAERYSVLWRLMTAKTAETRTARLDKMLKTLASEKRIS